jgi:NAD(P)-dependent dehydrogenase (short-subunit alcohol dehydrogenase family)
MMPEGFERQWATNVLGPHLLTKLLLPALEASGHGRIITVSTLAAGRLDLSDTQYEKRHYSGTGAYRASKQASRMLRRKSGRWPGSAQPRAPPSRAAPCCDDRDRDSWAAQTSRCSLARARA